ncbi:MAG: hypothetical protein ACT4OI_10750 [Methanobacteriota archaeon]
MDPMWLVIPVAVGLFLARTVMLARRLKIAAANPTLSDVRALRDAKRSLTAHRGELGNAIAAAKGHLEAAKRLARAPSHDGRSKPSGVARVVEDALVSRET